MLLTHPLPYNEKVLMQKLGYAPLFKKSGESSYVRRLTREEFPRFHIYLKESEQGFLLNIHLDQKAACHQNTKAHSGEYDGKLVFQEQEFIKNFVEKCKRELMDRV